MTVLVGVLVATAVLLVARPPRGTAGLVGAGCGSGAGRAAAGRRARSGRWLGGREGTRRVPVPSRRPADGRDVADLADLLHGVAAQLRAGAPPPSAWARVLREERAGPFEPAALGEVLRHRTGCGPGRRHAALRARVDGVVAGVGVAAATGAPLADVLEDLADAVAADAEQAGELEAALAGPRATARVLTLLPALGVLVGSAMGARPWAVLADGGLGTALGMVGAGLVAAGRAWVAVLLRRAAGP